MAKSNEKYVNVENSLNREQIDAIVDLHIQASLMGYFTKNLNKDDQPWWEIWSKKFKETCKKEVNTYVEENGNQSFVSNDFKIYLEKTFERKQVVVSIKKNQWSFMMTNQLKGKYTEEGCAQIMQGIINLFGLKSIEEAMAIIHFKYMEDRQGENGKSGIKGSFDEFIASFLHQTNTKDNKN